MTIKAFFKFMYNRVKEPDNTQKIGEHNGGMNIIFHENKVKVTSGLYSYGTVNVHSFRPGGEVRIGNYTSISDITLLMGGNHHTDLTTYPLMSVFYGKEDNKVPRNISIGSDVWIGFNSLIMEGVSIGDGAIIGAGALITRDVPPFSVVVGNPGRIVKFRFEESVIERLLRVKWWDLDIDTVRGFIDLLYTNDIDTLERHVASTRDSN